MNTEEILVIDNNDIVRETLRAMLEDEGFTVHTCEGGIPAFNLATKRCFRACLVDYRMPDMNGDEVTRHLRKLCPDSLIIGFSIESKWAEFKAAGANKFIYKDELPKQLILALKEETNKDPG